MSSMQKVSYTEELKEQLENIRACANEMAKEDPDKSVQQLLAEIEFVKGLLEEVKELPGKTILTC